MLRKFSFFLHSKSVFRGVLAANYRNLHQIRLNFSTLKTPAEPSSTRSGVADETSNRSESEVPIIVSRESPSCKQPPEPPEPGLCCMTGCANCVWISHVEELLDFYKDKGKDAAREALEKVPDENLKAFLKIELELGK